MERHGCRLALVLPALGLGARTAWRPPGRMRGLSGAALLMQGAAQDDYQFLGGIHGMDTNGDGFADKVELMYVVRDLLDAQGEEDKGARMAIFEGFNMLYEASDIDGDGVLSATEVDFASRLAKSGPESDFGRAAAKRFHAQVDADGGGSVDLAEFKEHLRAALPINKAEELSDATFALADVDGDQGLTWLECQYAVLYLFDVASEDLVSKMFDRIDGNRDGRMSRQEVLAAVEERRRARPQTPDGGPGSGLLPLVMDGFAAADADGDGHLDAQEARRLLDYLLV